jgi:hypothetical protein
MTAATPAADRKTLLDFPPWEPAEEHDWAATIIETEPKKRVPDKVTVWRYEVDELPPASGGRLFEFAKAPDFDGPRDAEVYATWVHPDGRQHCSCTGAVTRKQDITCKHVLCVRAHIAERAAKSARDHAAREAALPEVFRGLGSPPCPEVPF